MIINANTKIGLIIRHIPEALEAIVSISPGFTKLRNPILRKVVANRASIAMASKIGGCTVDDFFNKLEPLGFEIDRLTAPLKEDTDQRTQPDFMKNIQSGKIVELDVRPVIASGKDPLNLIMQHVKALVSGNILKITNTFEPTPLVHLLGKQGFESYVEVVNSDLVHTYFFKRDKSSLNLEAAEANNTEGWDELNRKFACAMEQIDVRNLEMPLPMHTILGALESLPQGKALFVYHKRIPVFLLPELQERKFSYRIREIGEGEVHLLIYRT